MSITTQAPADVAERVLAAVAAEFNTTVNALRSRSRLQQHCLPRHLALALLVEEAGLTWRAAAASVNRDTHAAEHAKVAMRDRRDTEPRFAERYNRLRDDLRAKGILP